MSGRNSRLGVCLRKKGEDEAGEKGKKKLKTDSPRGLRWSRGVENATT